jgi:hypothetical protein
VLRLASGLSVHQLCDKVDFPGHEKYRYWRWERDNGISTRKWRERIMAVLDPRHTVPSLWRDPYATMRGRSKVPVVWVAQQMDVAVATVSIWLKENYIPNPAQEEKFRQLCQLYKAPRGIENWRQTHQFSFEQMAALCGVKVDRYRQYEDTPWDIGEREYDRLWNVMRMTTEEARRVLAVLGLSQARRRKRSTSFTNPKAQAAKESE